MAEVAQIALTEEAVLKIVAEVSEALREYESLPPGERLDYLDKMRSKLGTDGAGNEAGGVLQEFDSLVALRNKESDGRAVGAVVGAVAGGLIGGPAGAAIGAAIGTEVGGAIGARL